jgi:Zn-dependent M16 (insulinase) family peptidase
MKAQFVLISIVLMSFGATNRVVAQELSDLKQNQKIGDFAVANLYADADGKIVGAKFLHTLSTEPVFVIQIETAPQTFMWVDTPVLSNRGLAHSLEHLLARKGTKGRYLNLLRIMRLSQFGAASYEDYNLYCLTSGTGMAGFTEQFDAFLDALYAPDFTDIEAEREFYHLGIASDPTTSKRHLIEQGTVYNEEQTDQGSLNFYFELNKQQFGRSNPFAFNIGGSPDEMRDVTPAEIRQFHAAHYRLGPGTGFIFVFSPKENVTSFLTRISADFARLPTGAGLPVAPVASKQPKYDFTPSTDKEIKIYPFPSANDSDRGEVRFGWEPTRANSQVELRLLQLFLRAVADGERSLLYKSLIDTKSKTLNSEATSIESQVFLGNSPWFPAESIGLSGIPGNRITTETVEQLRQHILRTIKRVSLYSDDSQELLAFNHLVMSYAKAWERDQRVWMKSAPLFGSEYKTEWKEHLNYLETDSSFVRSLSDTAVWQNVESQIKAGKNPWRAVILRFHLLETPYATASKPSSQMLAKLESERKQRVQEKVKQLERVFGVTEEQQALEQYEQIELKKTAEIDSIDSKVARPRFTDHPPLTPDDDIQFEQLRLSTVPVIAVLFDRAPTIDVGMSFDLRQIPEKYYKYLPILPRSFDSVGLKTQSGATSYSDLLAETQRDLSAFSIEYSSNAASRRADLAIRASTTSPQELQTALTLISEMLQFSNVDISTVDRLRDLVNERLADDDGFRTSDSGWLWKLSNAFRYQDDPLYTALNSHFTQAHWDGRLRWLLHQPVSRGDIQSLGSFAERILASSQGVPANQLATKLSQLEVTGLEKELVQYWLHNISSFPESGRLRGLRQLTTEVQEDLTAGPAQSIKQLMELQRLVVDRNALRVDITVDPSLLADVKPMLTRFIGSIPEVASRQKVSKRMDGSAPIMRTIEKRVGASGDNFPWYVGLEDSHSVNGGVVFSADFLGYTQLDRQSLIIFLASKLASGTGPHTFFMKTIESGLAYSNSIGSDPRNRVLMYYADRVPDIASLVQLVNSVAASIPNLDDASLLDYTLQKAFPFQRSMSAFADRGRSLAHDIYDGNEPAKIRRFSEAILRLRDDRGLMLEVTRSGLPSIGPVLLKPEFRNAQRSQRSIFFLVGPERLLADAEKRLAIPRLLRMYPCDFWMD